MPATPIYALPYPAPADLPDVPLDMQELADRVEAVFPGKELAYVQITAPVSVTATVEASANTVLTAPAITVDGSTPIRIEFYGLLAPPTIAAAKMTLWLFQDGASIGTLGVLGNPAAANALATLTPARRLTPPSGSRTYSVRGTVTSGTGTVWAAAGTAPGQDPPAFLRITRV